MLFGFATEFNESRRIYVNMYVAFIIHLRFMCGTQRKRNGILNFKTLRLGAVISFAITHQAKM